MSVDSLQRLAFMALFEHTPLLQTMRQNNIVKSLAEDMFVCPARSANDYYDYGILFRDPTIIITYHVSMDKNCYIVYIFRELDSKFVLNCTGSYHLITGEEKQLHCDKSCPNTLLNCINTSEICTSTVYGDTKWTSDYAENMGFFKATPTAERIGIKHALEAALNFIRLRFGETYECKRPTISFVWKQLGERGSPQEYIEVPYEELWD